MTMSTVPVNGFAEIDSPVQMDPEVVNAEDESVLVEVRLHGRWEDIMVALDHWGIETTERARPGTGPDDEECVVNGVLRVDL